jgi:tetratricopeptide (TPR) repeat protein
MQQLPETLEWSSVSNANVTDKPFSEDEVVPLVMTAEDQNEQGAVFFSSGQLHDALHAFQACLRMQEDRLGATNISACDPTTILDVATALNNIGMVLTALGRPSEALRYFLRCLPMEEEVAPGTEEVAQLHTHIATIYSTSGQLEEALHHFRETLRLEQRLAPGSINEATAQCNIGLVLMELGDLSSAVEHLRDSISVYEDMGNPPELEVAAAYYSLGVALHRLGDFEGALVALCLNCIETQEVLLPNSPELEATYEAIALVYMAMGQPSRALDMRMKAVGVHELRCPESTRLPEMLAAVADLLFSLGRVGEAAAVRFKAQTIIGRLRGETAVPAGLSPVPQAAAPPELSPQRAKKVVVNKTTMLTLFSLWKKVPHPKTRQVGNATKSRR